MNAKTGKKIFFIKFISCAVPALIILTALTLVLLRDKKDTITKSDINTALKTSTPVYRRYPVMGTWAEITLYADRETAEPAMDEIYESLNKINNVCSRFNPQSELSRLNASAAEQPFKCSMLLWDILIESKYFYDLSEGSFDITITPLMKLWGFYQKQNKIPSKKEIKNALTFVGLSKVVFNSENRSVFFKKPGIQIDLGGIAKGFAVDYAYKRIKKYNIHSGVINLGGNIRFFPAPPPGKKYYSAGIRNPFRKTEIMDGTLKLLNVSLATSGDYEQFIVLDGKRFAHIINPKTGYPVKDMAAVTIIAPSALACDALSTAVFINGNEFAQEIHKKFPDIDIMTVKGYHKTPTAVKVIKLGKIWKNVRFNSVNQVKKTREE
jgi:FAD:protein FMN transferase